MHGARWFALKVKSRHEKFVDTVLQHKGYEHFLPLYEQRSRRDGRLHKSELPLFPTYTFCQFDPQDKLPILITPGVVSIVGSGRTPIALAEEEVESVRLLARARVNVTPYAYMQVGNKVRIESGPLTGVQGLLISQKNFDTVVVSINLIQRSVAVELPSGSIRAVELGA